MLVAALMLLGPAAFAVRTVVGATSAKRHRHGSLAIKGNLRAPLWPGSSQRLDLKLINRRHFTLWITRLRVRVSVDRRHRAAGCSARRDFAVRQLPARAYPIRLPRKSTRKLSLVRRRALPRVRMRDLAHTNQDACKGASLRLKYRARARKSRPHGRRPRAVTAESGVRTP